MSSALDTISAMEVKLQSKREEKLQQIESTFDALVEILGRERNYFKDSVKKTFQEKENFNSIKKNEVSKTLENITSLIHYIEVASPQRPKPEFLTDIDHTRQRIKDLDTSSRSLQLEPTPSPEMEVELLDPAELEDLCKTRNFTYQEGDVLKGHIERSIDLTSLPVQETAEIPLNLQTQNVKKGKISVYAEFTNCHDKSMEFQTAITVKKDSAEKYILSFTPKQSGWHRLFIKYNDRYICGSPLPVHVTMKPVYLRTTELQGVAGIKCHQGKLFASILNKEIVILDAMLTRRGIPVYGVSEIAIDDVHIYATDISKHRIVKISLNGIVVQSTGRKGDGPGEFVNPNGIRLSKDDKLYVCDSDNNNVQVFDKELKFERSLGRKGRANGCFENPDDLDFDDAGNLYIVDQNNHRIQVLTPQGQHVRNIGRHGSGRGELNRPVSAAVHRNMIYITDTSNERISVFKLTGEFVTTFGEGVLTSPECIAIDGNGYIHVSDDRSRLVTFIHK